MNSFNYQGADNQSLSALQLLSGSVLIQWKKKQIDGAIAVGDRFWDALQQHSKAEIQQAMPEVLRTPKLVAIAANILRRPDVARLWLDRIVALDGPQATDHERSAQGFLYGTIAFEEGRFDEAYNYFKASYSFEGEDAFKGFPRWYWTFFSRREELFTEDLLEALIGNSGEKQQQAQQEAMRAQQAQFLQQAQQMAGGAAAAEAAGPQQFPVVHLNQQGQSGQGGAQMDGRNQNPPQNQQFNYSELNQQSVPSFNNPQFAQGQQNFNAQAAQSMQNPQVVQQGQGPQGAQFAELVQNPQFLHAQQQAFQDMSQIPQFNAVSNNPYPQPAQQGGGQAVQNGLANSAPSYTPQDLPNQQGQQWQELQQGQPAQHVAQQPGFRLQHNGQQPSSPGRTQAISDDDRSRGPYLDLNGQGNQNSATSVSVKKNPSEESASDNKPEKPLVGEESRLNQGSGTSKSYPVDPVDALGEKGSALYGEGDVIAAVAMWQQALNLMPKDDSRAWWFYTSLADGHIQLKEYKEAWEATNEAMKAGAESSALAWYCRGVAQYELGGRQDAMGSLKTAYSLGGAELFAVGGEKYLQFLKDNDAI